MPFRNRPLLVFLGIAALLLTGYVLARVEDRLKETAEASGNTTGAPVVTRQFEPPANTGAATTRRTRVQTAQQGDANDNRYDAFTAPASDVRIDRSIITPPALPNDIPENETPEEALQRILDNQLAINAHEHIQDTRQMQIVLDAMERNGMAKTVLMGSSWFTITLQERVGFTRYDENNEELMKIAAAHPDRFEAWPTLDPEDPFKLQKIKDLINRGATGVKLYTGHGYERRDTGEYMFHTIAMDDPEMFPFYAYCQENHIPLCFHVNPFKPGFADEFIRVLTSFPDLKVNAPHFILSSIRDSRLREFLDTFPNLYSDVSFGHDDFLTAGLRRISRDPEKFIDIFTTYPDRFMFGTDLVMTEASFKDADWFTERAQAYYDMLTQETYTTPLLPGETLNGLQLSSPLLDQILYQNYHDFVASRPEGTVIEREIEWGNLGVPYLERAPGEALPPAGSSEAQFGHGWLDTDLHDEEMEGCCVVPWP